MISSGRIINRTVAGFLLFVLGVAVTLGAGVPLFTDHFPLVPATVPVLSPGCTSANMVSVPSAVAPGSSGGVDFGCGTGTTVTGPAFTVNADGAAIPTFTLPVPYTGVAIIQSATVPTIPCSTSTGPGALTSGTAFSFTGNNGKGNSFYYCLTYTNAPTSGLPSLDIAWSQ